MVELRIDTASIGGTFAKASLARLDRQVLKHEPDLVIVCFGLNDVNGTLEDYTESLREIFTRCLATGTDVIFMTPNMLNTHVVDDTPKQYYAYAHKTADMQNNGRMDSYMAAAIAVAEELNVPVCDCYAKWKALAKTQDVTMLLANRINHPIPEMHELFAESLYELIMQDAQCDAETQSTMYEKA
jgi:lysophospholipase L1-like esterase